MGRAHRLAVTVVASILMLSLGACQAGEPAGESPTSPEASGGPAPDQQRPGTGAPDDTLTATAAPSTRGDAVARSPAMTRADVVWHDETLRPVSGPELVDGMIVLYTADEDAGLQITGLSPEGGVAWQHPASTSSILEGVGLHVVAVDDKVVHLEPVDGDRSGQARVVVRDPASGRATATETTTSVHRRLPGSCPGDTDRVCLWTEDLSGGDLPVFVLLDDGWPGTYVQEADAYPYDDPIGPLGLMRATGQDIGRVEDGALLWSVDTREVAGGDASTSSGWHFQAFDDDALLVGSVGVTDDPSAGSTLEMRDYALFALDAATGERRWLLPRAHIGCDVDLHADPEKQEGDDPLLACRYRSGQVRVLEDGIRVTDLEVDLLRVDPASGDILWSADLTPDGPVTRDTLVAATAVDRDHVLVLGHLVDVRDGSSHAVTDPELAEQAATAWPKLEDPLEVRVSGLGKVRVRAVDLLEQPADLDLASGEQPVWPPAPGAGVELEDGDRVIAHRTGVLRLSAP